MRWDVLTRVDCFVDSDRRDPLSDPKHLMHSTFALVRPCPAAHRWKGYHKRPLRHCLGAMVQPKCGAVFSRVLGMSRPRNFAYEGRVLPGLNSLVLSDVVVRVSLTGTSAFGPATMPSPVLV